ncbi:MAG: restriction endonuclease subunit S, partial [Desulfobulbaceae bacterium]|nr:restriction endonuclease subunit S [Desulfobulbaceae bacterium]
WKKKYKEPDAPGNVDFKAPYSWSLATVKQLAERVQYGSSSKTSEDERGVPVLRMGNIFEGELFLNKLKYLPKDHKEFPGLLLEADDLLFNRTNSPELVGKTATYTGKPAPCSFASYLIRVRLLEGVNPQFLSYYINSLYGRQWIKSVVSQQVGQANVNGTKLQALTVPVPPRREQNALVTEVENRFSVIKKLELDLDSNLVRAERLRQSILGKAFSGELLTPLNYGNS